MDKRLGSNPLDSLKMRGKKDLGYLEPPKPAKTEKETEKKGEICIHLKKQGNAYFCESPMARQHGLLGNQEEKEQKCGKCHARILK